MTNLSNDNGRAFEYACIKELEKSISIHRPAVINDKSIDGDLMFECIYYNKRGTFKIYEYILLIFVIMIIEYLILFKKEKIYEKK